MRPLGAFVLVFLEVQIKSTCISHNSFWIFSMKQCIMRQLNSVFVIYGIIKVSASVINLGHWPRLITLASTLIISDITTTSSNYCLWLPAGKHCLRNSQNVTRYQNREFCCMIFLYREDATFQHNISQHCWPRICKLRPNDRSFATLLRYVLNIENRTSAHAQVQYCCTNLAKRLHHATPANVVWEIWPVSNLSQQHPTCPNMYQQVAIWWPNARNMLRPTMLRWDVATGGRETGIW